MNKILYIIAILLLSTSCGDEKEKLQSSIATAAPMQDQTVILSEEQVNAIKIKSGKIEKRNITDVIKANGYLDVPPQNKAVISPMIIGYVRKINFLLGDNVAKGQIMAELESMEFIDLQQQYVELNARIVYLKEDFERQKLLRDQDAVSRKTYLMAEVEYQTAASTLKALKSKLELLEVNFDKLNKGEVASRILLKAPISGSVKKMNTVIGRHVDPSEEIFEIIDPEHLHLELSVFENNVPKVKKGQKVWFVVPSMKNQVFEGEIFLVGKDLSEEKRSINVHVHIDEDQAEFGVGMYANATIVIEDISSYTLPVTSVVIDGNSEYIFRQTKQNDSQFLYEKISITTGIEANGLVEITDIGSIKPGDEIVTEGAFYLLNAFLGGEILQ
jgi:cobalt-zinc-cadmium efflux system membrane fusion protein